MTSYRKIEIEPNTDAVRAFIAQWKLDHPNATNVKIELEKHCEGKQVTIDYDEEG